MPPLLALLLSADVDQLMDSEAPKMELLDCFYSILFLNYSPMLLKFLPRSSGESKKIH